MDNILLTVKERILLIAGHAKLSKIQFFKDLGLSYANFKGEQKKSGLSSDTLLKILSKYPEIDPSWLLLGVGEMLKSDTQQRMGAAEVSTRNKMDSSFTAKSKDPVLAAVKDLELLIEAQAAVIRTLQRRVEVLEKNCEGKKKKKKK